MIIEKKKIPHKARSKYRQYSGASTAVQTSFGGVGVMPSPQPSRLADLSDVSFSNLTNSQTVWWDGSSWANKTLKKADVGLSNVDNLSRAQILDNANLTGITNCQGLAMMKNVNGGTPSIWTDTSSLSINKWGGANTQHIILYDTFLRLDSNYFNINAPVTACNDINIVGNAVITGDTTIEGKIQTSSKAIFENGATFYDETVVNGQFNATCVDTNELHTASIYTDDSEVIINDSGADIWGCLSEYGSDYDYQSDYSVWGTHKVFGIAYLEANTGNIGRLASDYIDCQDLNVRGNLNVYEFTANKVRSTNGYLYVTDSDVITYVSISGLNAWVKFKEGNFRHCDILLLQESNGKNGINSTKFRVVGHDENAKSYQLQKSDGSTITELKEGSYLIRIDNWADDNRKSGILLSPYDGSYIDFYKGYGQGEDKMITTSIGSLDHLGIEGIRGQGFYSDNCFLKGNITATSGSIGSMDIVGDDLIITSTDSKISMINEKEEVVSLSNSELTEITEGSQIVEVKSVSERFTYDSSKTITVVDYFETNYDTTSLANVNLEFTLSLDTLNSSAGQSGRMTVMWKLAREGASAYILLGEDSADLTSKDYYKVINLNKTISLPPGVRYKILAQISASNFNSGSVNYPATLAIASLKQSFPIHTAVKISEFCGNGMQIVRSSGSRFAVKVINDNVAVIADLPTIATERGQLYAGSDGIVRIKR